MGAPSLYRPGSKWESLKISVGLFLRELISVGMKAKISLIIYDERSDIIFETQDPASDLLDQVTYSGFGTDFISPMKDAYKLAAKTENEFDEIAVFFFSDGSATYPEDEIRSFTSNNNLMNKIEFVAIGYGDVDFPVLN